MSNSLVSRRYAKALFKLLEGASGRDSESDKGKRTLQKNHEVLCNLAELFSHEAIRKVLVSPVIPKDLKREVLNLAAEKAGSSELMRQFISVVVDADRVSVFADLASIFKELVNQELGSVDAVVTSVAPLSSEELLEIETMLKSLTGKDIQLRTECNESILGGIQVRIGNSILDLSLRRRINQLTRDALA